MRKSHYYKEVHSGMTLVDVLLLVFIVLKLTGIIDWSWWWVLSPVWIWWSIALFLMAFAFIMTVISKALKKWKKKR